VCATCLFHLSVSDKLIIIAVIEEYTAWNNFTILITVFGRFSMHQQDQHDVKSCLIFRTNKMPTMSTGYVIVLPPANQTWNEQHERTWIPDIRSQRFQVMMKTHKHYCRSPNEIPLKHAQGSPIYSDDNSKKFVLSDLPFRYRHRCTITTKFQL
jgi:hypothetical protein